MKIVETESSANPSKISGRNWPLLLVAGAFGFYALRKKTFVGKAARTALTTASSIALRQIKQAQESKQYKAQASFLIKCAPERAFRFWRDFEKLPQFMQYLKSVQVYDDKRSDWTAEGPLGVTLHWSAEIFHEKENERIAWRTLPGSAIENSGSVEFHPIPNNKGTQVTATVQYTPPAGSLGRAFAAIFGKDPTFLIREDLRRFKALMEAGEIPTTKGQPHGPRGIHGKVQQTLLQEDQNIPQQAPDAIAPERRTA